MLFFLLVHQDKKNQCWPSVCKKNYTKTTQPNFIEAEVVKLREKDNLFSVGL